MTQLDRILERLAKIEARITRLEARLDFALETVAEWDESEGAVYVVARD